MKGRNFRVSGELKNADVVVDRTFWIGVYPGLTQEHVGYMIDAIEHFCRLSAMKAV